MARIEVGFDKLKNFQISVFLKSHISNNNEKERGSQESVKDIPSTQLLLGLYRFYIYQHT